MASPDEKTECLDENTALEFVRGDLAGEQAAIVDGHLSACADCRRLLLELARISVAEGATRRDAGAERAGMAEDRAAVQPLRIGASVGRYVILEPLGAGGMGVVYAAYDPELDRKIALKLLRPDFSDDRSGERLLREAQALARLSHPNVIAVHDAGMVQGRVFVAMEFVEGSTLTAWFAERGRDWREVLDVFAQAGRGLHAAHSAGIVHRDFKPQNVLFGEDGRVRVTDFGLATLALPATPETPRDPASPDDEGETPAKMTRSGAVLGTPAYMSPEQHAGGKADPRSDQFSFCVALYEGLYGKRPFAGETETELREAVTEGRLRAAPQATRVPGWVMRRVLRGLEVSPENRYPSVEELTDDLERDPGRSIRIAAMATGVIGLALAAFFLGSAAEPGADKVCENARQHLRGVWDPPQKQAIRDAFLATEKPYAKDAWQNVEGVLDEYARAWVAMRTEACEATHDRGEQSAELLDLRMQCLDSRLHELGALGAVFAKADVGIVANSVPAAHALSSLSDCADVRSLKAPVALPTDETERARVEELRRRIAEGRALMAARRLEAGLADARAMVEEARAVGYGPTLAEALFLLGAFQHASGDAKTSQATFREAVLVAEAAGHDDEKADILSTLAWIVGENPKQIDRALELFELAEATLARLGGDESSTAKLLDNLGIVYRKASRLDEALDHHQRALAIRERILDPEDPGLAITTNNVGAVLLDLGRYAEAVEHFERALGIWTQAFGPRHPQVAIALNNLGGVRGSQGRHDEALSFHERALAIRQQALGEEHFYTGISHYNLGLVLKSAQRPEEALARYVRAGEIFAKAFSPNHPLVGKTQSATAMVLIGLGRYEEARQALESALSIAEASAGKDSPDVGFALNAMGMLQMAEKRPTEAVRSFERALAVNERVYGADHVTLTYDLAGIGTAYLELRRPAKAIAPLERALGIAEKQEVEAHERAKLQFGLARALVGRGRDRKRAVALARAAREGFAQSQGAEKDLAEVDAWLAKRAPNR